MEQTEQFAALCRHAFAPEHGRRWKTAAAEALAIGRTTLYRYLSGEVPVPGDVRARLAALSHRPQNPYAGTLPGEDRMTPEQHIAGAGPSVHRRRIHREPARRPRGLYQRRARRRRHHAPGVPQFGALASPGSTTRCTTRATQGRADLPDRHRLGRLHPQIFPRRRARARSCAAQQSAIAEWSRMTYGWMGRTPDYKAALIQHARRQCRILRAVRGQRPRLVQARAGNRAVHEPRHRQSADRPRTSRPSR